MRLIGLAFLITVLFCSCDNYHFAKGVKKDFQKLITQKKQLFVASSFNGIVYKKKKCEKCDSDKFQIEINVVSFSPKLTTLGDKLFPPFYSFNNENQLTMMVTKDLYESIKVGDLVLKEPGSYYLIVNSVNYELLSKEKYDWLSN
ncbi:hypothetical protein [Pedobacter gandavensis]|uniref:hypothetical protein n=1 Tax=Pedobacter gandavensis TaxID=2679963 RepID=UPI002930C394|nr:hypothetical protein [Pedobacter gandavensis]